MKKNKPKSTQDHPMMKSIRWAYPKLEKVFPKIAHRLAFRLFFTPLRYPRPQRELAIMNEAIQSKSIIAGKQTVFYSWGQEQNPVVLLVHGWMGRATQFHYIIGKLIENGYQVVAFDGPAHGESKGNKTDIREFKVAIQHVETKYGSISAAIGHSFGGAALIFSMHGGIKIDKLVMIASPAIGIKIVESYAKLLNGSYKTVEAFLKLVLKKFNMSFKDVAASNLAQEIDIKHLLIVHDELDYEVFIEHAEKMRSVVPEAKVYFTNGLGHTRLLRDPGVAEAIVNFIGTNSARVDQPALANNAST
jgi:esterase/lipase